MNIARYLVVLAGCCAPALVWAGDNEKCFVEGMYEEYSTHHPLCLYYTGTEHYRGKDYLQASKQWERLLLINPFPKEYSELLISAHNNLGYLYFHGFGVEKDSAIALEHWHKAVSMGHNESEYHLCYAYGDPESAVFSPYEALPHCNKAELLYGSKEDRDQGDEEIINIIRKNRERVEKRIRGF